MAAFHQIGVSRVQSTKCCPPRPFRILALSLALLILLIHSASAASAYGTIGSAGAGAVSHHHSLSKRSYFDINCKGLYDKSIFARLDRICQDCYSLYREPELHTLCRYLKNNKYSSITSLV